VKHIYSITFKKQELNIHRSTNGGYSWQEVDTSDLLRRITLYCLDNNIKIKYLKIEDTFKNSSLKIKCSKNEYIKLVLELSLPKYMIDLLNIRI
jgi:hypothetical protein